MKQLIRHSSGRIQWQALPDPADPVPGAALVRPLAVATCDLDIAILRRGDVIPGTFPLGHEFVARVVEVGSGVERVAVGDLVSVPFQISCGTCTNCVHGLTANCQSVPALAGYGLGSIGGLEWGGAFADWVNVPFADAMLLRLPPDADAALLAGLSDNLTDAYRTVAGTRPGDDVLIIGGGSIGVIAAGMALAHGASVRYVDTDETRCRIAEEYGAAVEQRPLDSPTDPAPRVVHTSARPTQLRNALLSVAPGGHLIDTGVYWTPSTSVPLFDMYVAGVTFETGRAHVRRDMEAVHSLIASGRFDPSPVLTVRADWDEAVEALALTTVKTVITRS